MIRKKLQVFVSSTYEDMKEERQAAVSAILGAGHIPAGMELFAAGDTTQFETIRRWIDESDVFMLILGTRYGSIDPQTKKSYIHLEYDYALQKSKALFAVVMTEAACQRKVHSLGTKAVDNPSALEKFRKQVVLRMCAFINDTKDIELAAYKALGEFSKRSELVGWIPGDSLPDVASIADQLSHLGKENQELRTKLGLLEPVQSPSGASLAQIAQHLRAKMITISHGGGVVEDSNMLDAFVKHSDEFVLGLRPSAFNPDADLYEFLAPELRVLGLLNVAQPGTSTTIYFTNATGNALLAAIKLGLIGETS